MIDLLQALLQSGQVDMAFLARIQGIPEAGDSFVTFVGRLAGCHDRRENCYGAPGIIQGSMFWGNARGSLERRDAGREKKHSGQWGVDE